MIEHYRVRLHWSLDGANPACGQTRADGQPIGGQGNVRMTDQPRRVTCAKCKRIVVRRGLLAPIEGEQLPLDLPT